MEYGASVGDRVPIESAFGNERVFYYARCDEGGPDGWDA